MASSDKPAADAFKPVLKKCIEDGSYSARQVINYDETGVYWKKISSCTYIFEEEEAPEAQTNDDVSLRKSPSCDGL